MESMQHSVHTGKMEGIISFSCDKFSNKFCIQFSKIDTCICSKCYCNFLYKFYGKKFADRMQKNSRIVQQKAFVLPKIPKKQEYIRFNSFGELHNLNHLDNLIKICNAFPQKSFTLYTKRKSLVKRYFGNKTNKKPANLILIFSHFSIELNKIKPAIPDYFDKIFIVLSNNSPDRWNINCKKKCIECKICYTKNEIKYVYEMEKRN